MVNAVRRTRRREKIYDDSQPYRVAAAIIMKQFMNATHIDLNYLRIKTSDSTLRTQWRGVLSASPAIRIEVLHRAIREMCVLNELPVPKTPENGLRTLRKVTGAYTR